jgi:hypothetical protein
MSHTEGMFAAVSIIGKYFDVYGPRVILLVGTFWSHDGVDIYRSLALYPFSRPYLGDSSKHDFDARHWLRFDLVLPPASLRFGHHGLWFIHWRCNIPNHGPPPDHISRLQLVDTDHGVHDSIPHGAS